MRRSYGILIAASVMAGGLLVTRRPRRKCGFALGVGLNKSLRNCPFRG